MQVQFTFRQVDHSDALRDYAAEQLERVGRFLLKESRWQVIFSMGKIDCRVHILVSGPWGQFKTTAQADDFYHAVDLASEKLGRQFQKRKEQLQHHKRPEKSRAGRLERLNEALEYDNNPYFPRKSAS